MFVSKSMRAFITIAQEKSLKKAAFRLNLTVPPLSRMIKIIEEEIGRKLLIIERNNIKLTEYGEKIFNEIYPFYISLEKIKKSDNGSIVILSNIEDISFFLYKNYNALDFFKKKIEFRLNEEINQSEDLIFSNNRIKNLINFDEYIYKSYIYLFGIYDINHAKTCNIIANNNIISSESFSEHMMLIRKKEFLNEVKRVDDNKLSISIVDNYIFNSIMFSLFEFDEKKYNLYYKNNFDVFFYLNKQRNRINKIDLIERLNLKKILY